MPYLRPNEAIGVIGAGTMGAGIAQVAAQAGHPVLLFDIREGAALQAVESIASSLGRRVEKGKISASERDALIERIQVVDSLEAFNGVGMAIEVVVEQLAIKQQLFKDLERICSPEAILATNTSSISVTAISEALDHPERLVGMHFFNPAPVMKLVEVISGLATSETVAEKTFHTAKCWGKEPVHAKSTPGFIVNRVARPFYAEALSVLQEGGADVVTIDSIIKESGGFRMGPFELMDLIGHDVNYSVTQSVFDAYYYDQRFLPSLVQKELVNAGFLGKKSGRGFYHYADKSRNPESKTHHSNKSVDSVAVVGDLGVAEPLVHAAEEVGIVVEHRSGDGYIQTGKATLALTDGRMATQRSVEDQIENLVLFDLALDYQNARRIAISAAEQTDAEALIDAIAFFEAIGKKVSVIDDVPGLVLMRTVVMLANEGADAVRQGVCTAIAVDQSMKAGLNYPKGPLEWAQDVGLSYVEKVLGHLMGSYGLDRYRSSLLLKRKVFSGQDFYAQP